MWWISWLVQNLLAFPGLCSIKEFWSSLWIHHSRNSLLSSVNTLRPGRSSVRMPTEATDCCRLQNSHKFSADQPETNQPLILRTPRNLSAEIKRLGLKRPLTNVNVEYQWVEPRSQQVSGLRGYVSPSLTHTLQDQTLSVGPRMLLQCISTYPSNLQAVCCEYYRAVDGFWPWTF